MKTRNNMQENSEVLNIKQSFKNCKNVLKYCKKEPKISNLSNNHNCLNSEVFNLKVYVKTLLGIYKNLPNIINILDRIIERKASSLTTTESIYGGSFIETYNQVNKVINLSDRKDKLLNLYIIIESFLKALSDKDRKVIVLKFIQKNTTLEIAKELNIAERSVFRRINLALDKIVNYLLEQNWNIDFLKNQVGKESWIEDTFKQNLKEEIKSKKKS